MEEEPEALRVAALKAQIATLSSSQWIPAVDRRFVPPTRGYITDTAAFQALDGSTSVVPLGDLEATGPAEERPDKATVKDEVLSAETRGEQDPTEITGRFIGPTHTLTTKQLTAPPEEES